MIGLVRFWFRCYSARCCSNTEAQTQDKTEHLHASLPGSVGMLAQTTLQRQKTSLRDQTCSLVSWLHVKLGLASKVNWFFQNKHIRKINQAISWILRIEITFVFERVWKSQKMVPNPGRKFLSPLFYWIRSYFFWKRLWNDSGRIYNIINVLMWCQRSKWVHHCVRWLSGRSLGHALGIWAMLGFSNPSDMTN